MSTLEKGKPGRPCRKIVSENLTTGEIKVWNSIKECGETLNIDTGNIVRVLSYYEGVTGTKTVYPQREKNTYSRVAAKGHRFRYFGVRGDVKV